MRMDGILELGALALSQSLHNREISAEQLMVATLDRIDSVNPTVNAIVNRADRKDLLEQAQRCDEELKLQGKTSRGWLQGIPLAVKDNTHVCGFPTTNGASPLAKDPSTGDYAIPKETAPHIQRLIDAGALIIGKTNIPESAVGCHSANPLFGVTRNPYDPHRSAGGSSGGAAAAVAARMVCLADGTDMMGSLRNPAGWNHVYSLRPTAEYFKADDTPPSSLLDYPISMPGPIAREVPDLIALYHTLLPSKDMDVKQPQQQAERPFRKIAWLGDWAGAYPMEDGILDLCQESLLTFAQTHTGPTVQVDNSLVSSPIFDAKSLWQSWTTIRSVAIAEQVDRDLANMNAANASGSCSLESLNLKLELRWEVERGRRLTQPQIRQAKKIAKDYAKALETLFETYDAIALPSAQMWALEANIDSFPMEIGGNKLDSYHRWMEVEVPVSLAGLPCVTVPAGPDDGSNNKYNRFMGIQIAGKRGCDDELLDLVKGWSAKVVPVPSPSFP